jgi:hypothetical protein
MFKVLEKGGVCLLHYILECEIASRCILYRVWSVVIENNVIAALIAVKFCSVNLRHLLLVRVHLRKSVIAL